MNPTLKILIVEDEAITAENLKLTLQSLGYEVVGIANNATDAIDLLLNKKIDFAILDIQIQGNKNGIWLANYIRKTYDIPYIFLTAFGDEKTILEATSTKPYGYLLKPFIKQNLLVAIKIALINYTKNTEEKTKNIIANKDAIFIKQQDAYVKMYIENILFLEADKNYVKVQTTENHFVIRSTLTSINENLPDTFLQIHRSFVVNTNMINEIKAVTILVGQFTLPLSNSYKVNLLAKLNIG